MGFARVRASHWDGLGVGAVADVLRVSTGAVRPSASSLNWKASTRVSSAMQKWRFPRKFEMTPPRRCQVVRARGRAAPTSAATARPTSLCGSFRSAGLNKWRSGLPLPRGAFFDRPSVR